MLGPLWLTLSMGAMIGGMGPLYSSLFGTELSKFFPHLALGIIFWGFFSSVVDRRLQRLRRVVELPQARATFQSACSSGAASHAT